MNIEELFKDELNYIKSEDLKKSLVVILKSLPDYWYSVPASSTGKYHPEYALGEGGLLRHSKAAMRIGYELLSDPVIGEKYNEHEKDLLLISLLVHDGLKSGNPKEKYTRFDHPILMANYILENKDNIYIEAENANEILYNIIEEYKLDFEKIIKYVRETNSKNVLDKLLVLAR